MLLDKVMLPEATLAHQLTDLPPAARDELAYVVLVGLVGQVPDSRVVGEFRVGQLSLRYAWLTEASIAGTVVAHTENLKLSVFDGALLPGTPSIPIGAVLELWAFVQAHSDSVAYWPASQRQKWISSTAQAFGTTYQFVQNLASNYPQLRRLCS